MREAMKDNELRVIERENLVSEAMLLREDGYRLIQICATKTQDGYELTYSFGLDYEFVNLRIELTAGQDVDSISGVYSPAFLYENEIHDLFGIEVTKISLDYHGTLYRLKNKTPFE